MEQDKTHNNYESLGGWLLVFILWRCFSAICSFINLFSNAKRLNDFSIGYISDYDTGRLWGIRLSAAFNLCFLLISLYIIAKTLKKETDSLNIVTKAMKIEFKIRAVVAAFYIITLLPYVAGLEFLGMGMLLIYSLPPVITHFSIKYFEKSERVRVYFDSTQPQKIKTSEDPFL